jgi:hypothetical protein
MKYLVLFLVLITISSCDGLKPKEVVVSNEGKKWYVEIIEEHEFLHRHSGEAVIYIHRPNCKKCNLK